MMGVLWREIQVLIHEPMINDPVWNCKQRELFDGASANEAKFIVGMKIRSGGAVSSFV
jgi:hypothetical protein